MTIISLFSLASKHAISFSIENNKSWFWISLFSIILFLFNINFDISGLIFFTFFLLVIRIFLNDLWQKLFSRLLHFEICSSRGSLFEINSQLLSYFESVRNSDIASLGTSLVQRLSSVWLQGEDINHSVHLACVGGYPTYDKKWDQPSCYGARLQ